MNQAAWAAIRSPDGIILREFYNRVRSTKGKKKAIIAVGRKMPEILPQIEKQLFLYHSYTLNHIPIHHHVQIQR